VESVACIVAAMPRDHDSNQELTSLGF